MNYFRALRGVALLLAIGLLLMALATVAGADGAQLWYLDSEATTAGLEMEKASGPGDDGQSGPVSIASGGSVIWISDQSAQTDVTFASGSWVVEIRTDTYWGPGQSATQANCEMSVGEWDPTTTTFNAFTTSTAVAYHSDSGQNILKVLQASSETVHQNKYLALMIKNLDPNNNHDVITNGCSELTSPCEDPGYPVPEIAAGVLFGLGLIGLLGYVGIRRMRNKKAIG